MVPVPSDLCIKVLFIVINNRKQTIYALRPKNSRNEKLHIIQHNFIILLHMLHSLLHLSSQHMSSIKSRCQFWCQAKGAILLYLTQTIHTQCQATQLLSYYPTTNEKSLKLSWFFYIAIIQHFEEYILFQPNQQVCLYAQLLKYKILKYNVHFLLVIDWL